MKYSCVASLKPDFVLDHQNLLDQYPLEGKKYMLTENSPVDCTCSCDLYQETPPQKATLQYTQMLFAQQLAELYNTAVIHGILLSSYILSSFPLPTVFYRQGFFSCFTEG